MSTRAKVIEFPTTAVRRSRPRPIEAVYMSRGVVISSTRSSTVDRAVQRAMYHLYAGDYGHITRINIQNSTTFRQYATIIIRGHSIQVRRVK